ncbi:MAG: acyl-CoA dehydrogenase family protein [Parvibaculum sp.]|uniref:acyl-CoA dehydrogenase family protein n=1 Tax=Parvibaculum sp. TaxID=2024848 RepID=UPI00283AC157|nr:acyl-CoA dehydrogenase family protein [Parvibaculum sp.]MDR3498265.1 acyl-CoA dehydrogenase family protein [Parvibaculum sp.]
MDLALNKDDAAFREEVRRFLKDKLPREIAEANSVGVSVEKPLLKRWHRALYDQGWVAPGWPKEAGGTGWTVTQRHIFNEECAQANAPRLMPFGLGMVGPVIYTFGTPAQKAQHLPGILTGETWWCQGYSEPGAGSDLAALKTKAVKDGDHYVVNGQKIWTSYAHEADWIFCLVRTDDTGKTQEGISFLLIDMKTPGITVRPIVSIDELHHLNEVFFEDVRVPVANRIGEENKGWTYAKYLLTHERTGIAGVPESKKAVERLHRISEATRAGDGKRLADEPDFQRKLAEIEVSLAGLDITNLRILADAAAGRAVGERSSILKVVGTEIQQALQLLAVEAIGYYTLPSQRERLEGRPNAVRVGPDHVNTIFAGYAFGRAATIYGGSNEIQRNVLAKAVLGL